MPNEQKKDEIRQVVRFIIIGGTSVVIDLAVYYLLTDWAINIHIAKGISYISGMIFGFWGNKYWTFRSGDSATSESASYLIIYSSTFVINITINGGVLSVATLLYPDYARFGKLFAFFAATGVSTVLNFLGMRFITFRKGIIHRREEGSVAKDNIKID